MDSIDESTFIMCVSDSDSFEQAQDRLRETGIHSIISGKIQTFEVFVLKSKD